MAWISTAKARNSVWRRLLDAIVIFVAHVCHPPRQKLSDVNVTVWKFLIISRLPLIKAIGEKQFAKVKEMLIDTLIFG